MERRNQIIKILEQSAYPVSGTELAKTLRVSRQVIVQDIALLRAENHLILSTNKGYLMYRAPQEKARAQRVVCVRHTKDQIRDELCTIIDNGGRVCKVMVEHDIYGQISADLLIFTRRDIEEFVDKVEQSDTRPLNCLTDGVHYHVLEADNERILDEIEEELERKRYLLRVTDTLGMKKK